MAPDVRVAVGEARAEFEKAWDVWDRACARDQNLWHIAGKTTAPAWDESIPGAPDGGALHADAEYAGAEQTDDAIVAGMRRAQREWLRTVFTVAFEWPLDNDLVFAGPGEVAAPRGTWSASSSDATVCVEPTFVMQAEGEPGLAVLVVDPAPSGDDDAISGVRSPGVDGWAASAVSRMEQLLTASGVPIGLVTDGRYFAVVYVGEDALPASGVWDCFAWTDEPLSLAALSALLKRSQVVGGREDERLARLFERSQTEAEQITESLGTQVRQAVELLVTALSDAQEAARAHAERETGSVPEALVQNPGETYHASVTVMMRVVFLLFAGERGLLPQGQVFTGAYGLVGVYDELKRRESAEGAEALDGTSFVWHRLLATSQVLFHGAPFEREVIPAYGGELFDPSRFPQLTAVDGAGNLATPVSDRVMLAVLEAVQVAVVKSEARRVSFQEIDVEQIGYIYEGLLGYTARAARRTLLGLEGPAGKEPAVPLDVLEALALEHGDDASGLAAGLMAWVQKEQSGAETVTKAKLAKALKDKPDEAEVERAVRIVTRSPGLQERLRPWMPLVRKDLRGAPMVVLSGSVVVAETSARKDAGAHYTPKSLAEEVARHALEPLVYSPGPHQTAEKSEWRLKSASEIRSLKVADIACGSGAFLVAAARYLADKLVEAGRQEGLHSGTLTASEAEKQRVGAVRSVVAHCLYGADINPLAVEMCKLSLWLVSLDREQPFSFVDDKILVGNSLLGVTSRKQLRDLRLGGKPPADQAMVIGEGFAQVDVDVERVLGSAADLRREIATEVRTDDPLQTRTAKARLLSRFRDETDGLRSLADGIVAAALSEGGELTQKGQATKQLEQAYDRLRLAVAKAFPDLGEPNAGDLRALTAKGLALEVPTEEATHWQPLHWAVELPDVMARGGFDAIIGNPPFLGGKKISMAFGSKNRSYLVNTLGRGTKGNADLVAYFLLQAVALLRPGGCVGVIATNTLAQGETRKVGLEQIVAGGFTITRAIQSRSWPSDSADLEFAAVWGTTDKVDSRSALVVDDDPVLSISTLLEPAGRVIGVPRKLAENSGIAFQGCIVLGKGFVLKNTEVQHFVDDDPRNAEILFPYMNGEDLNSHPDCSTERWVIDFGEKTEDAARKYKQPWQHLHREVRPGRQKKDGEKYPRMVNEWWKHWNARPNMREAIANLAEVLVIARVASAVMPMRVSTDFVFSEQVVVFATDSFSDQAVLSSSLHRDWAIQHGSTMRKDVRYTPTGVFETFPFSEPDSDMEALGEELHAVRQEIMLRRELGLTDLYNLVNDSTTSRRDRDVRTLRDIHQRLDHAVAAAYGWGDISLDHGFHTYRQVTRWTVCPAARVELMDRLLEENHRRHSAAQKD